MAEKKASNFSGGNAAPVHSVRLAVKNFMGIEKTEIVLRRLNVIVGPQASGKSIIAKLFYFMARTASRIQEGASEGLTKKDIDQDLSKTFCQIFPPESWGEGDFEVAYKDGEFELTLCKMKSSGGVKFSYGGQLKKFVSAIRSFRGNLENDEDEIGFTLKNWRSLRRYQKERSKYHFGDRFADNAIFIPAGRSYYSAVKEGVWDLIAKSISVDPIYSDFGSLYETSKSIWSRYSHDRSDRAIQEFEKGFLEVMRGTPFREKDSDFILTEDGRKVRLTNASSGQQEVFPLFSVLRAFLFPIGGINRIFIEEPEAHLFPAAQAKLMWLIAFSANRMNGSSILITTHSPYVLATLNNLMLASKLNHKPRRGKISRITKGAVKPEDVTAYSMGSGEVKALQRDDLGLIDAEIIDEISVEISELTDQLLEEVLEE